MHPSRGTAREEDWYPILWHYMYRYRYRYSYQSWGCHDDCQMEDSWQYMTPPSAMASLHHLTCTRYHQSQVRFSDGFIKRIEFHNSTSMEWNAVKGTVHPGHAGSFPLWFDSPSGSSPTRFEIALSIRCLYAFHPTIYLRSLLIKSSHQINLVEVRTHTPWSWSWLSPNVLNFVTIIYQESLDEIGDQLF